MYYNYSSVNLAFPGEQIMEMKYCMHCGHKLDEKYLMGEGMVPYCPECQEFRFPVYNTAVSMIVMNKELDKVLLIKQYGRDSYILVAGYVNKGEDAEDAVKREIGEELAPRTRSKERLERNWDCRCWSAISTEAIISPRPTH